MSSAKITLIGMTNWMKDSDDDLFSLLTLPEGIDKDTLIGSIMLRGGEFEVLYSNPYVFQAAIGVWASKHDRTFSKWYEALQIEYKPLENYDRFEESEDINESSGEDESEGTGQNSSENKTSAFDSSAYQPDSESKSSIKNNNKSSTSSNSKNNHTAHLHGNIGVTTSQQMLESELDISKWNIYEQIADLFCDEFTIMVY